jgi:hypothetical protein
MRRCGAMLECLTTTRASRADDVLLSIDVSHDGEPRKPRHCNVREGPVPVRDELSVREKTSEAHAAARLEGLESQGHRGGGHANSVQRLSTTLEHEHGTDRVPVEVQLEISDGVAKLPHANAVSAPGHAPDAGFPERVGVRNSLDVEDNDFGIGERLPGLVLGHTGDERRGLTREPSDGHKAYEKGARQERNSHLRMSSSHIS